MVKNFDHCTIVVSNIDETKRFFALLGFTLVLDGSSPRQEIQLLKYHNPAPLADPNITRLDKMGYNHLCFAADDIEQEIRRLKENGVKFLNEAMEFKNRKLTFFSGPEGITLELSEAEEVASVKTPLPDCASLLLLARSRNISRVGLWGTPPDVSDAK